MIPGEIITADGDILLNANRESIELTVENTGDRPVQVGSHYHFHEVNGALSFDRALARGMPAPYGLLMDLERYDQNNGPSSHACLLDPLHRGPAHPCNAASPGELGGAAVLPPPRAHPARACQLPVLTASP